MAARRSIRFRVTAIAVVTSAVVVLLFGWLFIELLRNRLVDDGQAELAAAASDIEGLALVELGEGGAQYQIEGGEYFMLLDLDDDGDVFVNVQSNDDPEGDSVGGFIIDSGTGELRGIVEESDELSRAELRQIAEDGAQEIRDIVAGTEGGRLQLLQATNDVIGSISDGVDAARSSALLVGPLLVLASGLITWVVVGRALAPTRRIAAEAAAIGTDTIDQRVSTTGAGDEVDTIAGVINQMLDRIEGGVRREQEFVADASHELRTPLTTARMAAELAADDAPTSPYPPQIVEEIDRMQALVDDLLQLARDPAGRPGEEVAVDDLVASVVAAHPHAGAIASDLASQSRVVGRSAELGRVVVNLLDNAARYGRAAVAVSTSLAAGQVVIAVEDDGPGIAPEHRDAVFDRFVRVDEGRGRTDGGTGLGLAIVKAIAERHGGSVSVGSSNSLGGARVEVRLPAASG